MEYDICRGVVEDGSDEQKEASIILDSKGFEAQDKENEFDLSSRGVGYRVEATGKGQFTDGKSVGKRKAVDRAMRNWKCGSEQYLWSLIRAKYPTYFHIMSYNYGDIDFLW